MSEIAAEIVQSEPAQQADPVKSFSFDGLHEQALAMMNDGPGTPEAVTPPAEQPAVSGGAPKEPVAENVDTASPSQLAQLKPTDLVEVTVDGQKVQMPWAEAQSGVMRQAHYTKSMQQLAREREQIAASRPQFETAVQERDALVTVLNDENLLRQILQAKYPHLVQKAQAEAIASTAASAGVDADDIATVGQVQEVAKQYAENLSKEMERVKGELAQQAETITRTIEDRQATFKLASEINTTIDSLKQAHPHIEKVVPNFNEVLRYNVAQLKPSTPEETLEAFKTVFGGFVENFNSAVAATNKTSVIQKQELLKNNIQPPGGAAVTPQPTDFKKTNKMTGKTELDWSKLNEAAMAMLNK
jgi:hypothetical protein